MSNLNVSCPEPFIRFRFPIFALLALCILGGIAPRGAELVPFRGTDAGDSLLLPPPVSPSSTPAAAAADPSVEADARAAVISMGRGDLQEAKKLFKSVLERHPQDLNSLVNLGWIAQRERKWEDAEAYLKRAQNLAPDNAPVWLALGIVYLEQNRVDFAVAAFSQVVALEPGNARAHRMLGLALGRKEWFAASEGELRKSLEIEPNDPGAHFNLAVIYLQRQPLAIELARRHYNISLDLGSQRDPKIDAILAQPPPVSSNTARTHGVGVGQ